ncbi:hypothetical protein GCM10022255_114470 [Dactylosporangium darangshiense]|uniref:Uncharacterized protein n=1 Tax=Dactylosporangium darangshiense TaxID=579108 RepID=A0ABP8DWK5_9ACTN
MARPVRPAVVTAGRNDRTVRRRPPIKPQLPGPVAQRTRINVPVRNCRPSQQQHQRPTRYINHADQVTDRHPTTGPVGHRQPLPPLQPFAVDAVRRIGHGTRNDHDVGRHIELSRRLRNPVRIDSTISRRLDEPHIIPQPPQPRPATTNRNSTRGGSRPGRDTAGAVYPVGTCPQDPNRYRGRA